MTTTVTDTEIDTVLDTVYDRRPDMLHRMQFGRIRFIFVSSVMKKTYCTIGERFTTVRHRVEGGGGSYKKKKVKHQQ